MKRIIKLLILMVLMPVIVSAQTIVNSPDRKTQIKITTENQTVKYSVAYNGNEILTNSLAGLVSSSLKGDYKLSAQKPTAKTETVNSPFYRQKSFTSTFNEQKIKLNQNLEIIFRVFNDGFAYRFHYLGKQPITVTDEVAEFNYPQDYDSWLSFSTNDKDPYAMAFQNIYSHKKISEQDRKLSFLPVVTDCGNVKTAVLESDLESYPGMFLLANRNGYKAQFARYPKKMDKYPWRGMTYVAEREDFIAKVKSGQYMPWRVVSITENDGQMPVSNLVYALNSPNRIGSTDWIIPGKSAWDWWNDWNIKGVDFKAGINTETYKYFIDFAASHNLGYIILDEGWYNSKNADILNPIDDINLEELITYANQRGVGIVLWAVFNVVDENIDAVMSKYSKMGVKGLKIDFLDRNDQTAVEMAYRIAAKAAEYHLVLDYHGFYPPTGMNRAYPNILNFESVFGMEEMKWNQDKKDMPLYDVTFPFIRMMCGPVDYTPGAMRNGTKHWYAPIYGNPMSMGTRCHQLAAYVVHDSPFTMLADAPSEYLQDEKYTDFLSKIPNDIDETRVLSGKIGEHIIVARRCGNDWYIGGLTNWDDRDLTVDFSFLNEKAAYKAILYKDGINANHNGEDYAVEYFTVKKGDKKQIHLASGGGFVIALTKDL